MNFKSIFLVWFALMFTDMLGYDLLLKTELIRPTRHQKKSFCLIIICRLFVKSEAG